MPKSFDLGSLIQEHDTITDVDGTVYELRNQADMGMVDMARAQRLQKLLPPLLKQLESNPDDADIAHRIENAIDELVGFIAPILPKERIAEMTVGQKQALLDFWSQAQRERQAVSRGEAPAGRASSSRA